MAKAHEEDTTFVERYSPASYLRDRAAFLALSVFCLLALVAMLSILGLNAASVTFVVGFVAFCLALMALLDYQRRARFFQEAAELVGSLSASRHFTSLIDSPASLEGRIAYQLIEYLSRLSSDEVDAARAEAEGYRGYVELWIHEIKTPIATAKLVLSDMHGPEAARLSREIERIEAQVDQALYYARSLSLTNDYAISELGLADVLRESCRKNARFLIENGTTPHIEVHDQVKVFSDRPWLVFMISQVVVNASKYGARTITFTSREVDEETPHECTLLDIVDDGIGIDPTDVPRVFDRGFTGKNGRELGSATGMGLYLVAIMAERMGIGVSLSSTQGKGTTVQFSFPHDRRRLSRS